ncbi:MAG: hypothetical protein WCA04_14515 [Geobacteraceae bacterium]
MEIMLVMYYFYPEEPHPPVFTSAAKEIGSLKHLLSSLFDEVITRIACMEIPLDWHRAEV